jgi:3-hydroxyisobutyrate dehydrogenase
MNEPLKTLAVGIVGVGNMGGGIARNLLNKGYSVYVNDLEPKRVKELEQLGAKVFDPKSSLPKELRVIIICVVSTDQIESVLGVSSLTLHSQSTQPAAADGAKPSHSCDHQTSSPGLLNQLDHSHCVLLCPTIGPDDVKSTASLILERGAKLIDAPMSGGPLRAQDGTMSLMVACEEQTYREHLRLLDDMAKPVVFISPKHGDAASTKLVNNLLAATQLVANAEALVLAERLGLSLERTLDVIESSSGQSWVGSDRMRRAVQVDPLKLEPQAHLSLLTKDTGLALKMAQSVGFQGSLGEYATQTFSQASQSGLANFDDACVLTYLRRQAKAQQR